jgi:hypothetical protein
MLEDIDKDFPETLDFRLAETPVFISADLKNKMLDTCEEILDVIIKKDFIQLTKDSIPLDFKIPNETPFPEMMVFDFGICKNENGETIPQLIEMQGFPSLFGYQLKLDELFRSHTFIPKNFNSFLNGYNQQSYLKLLSDIIIGENNPESVILLELHPEKQKTKIDFRYTEKLLGVSTVCISSLLTEGNKIYYIKENKKIQVKRIFNRIVFDEFKNITKSEFIDLSIPYEVEWTPHPNWFYRISKFTLPFIKSPYVPPAFFLNKISIPESLDSFILKPLFSFAGKGVNLHPKTDDIAAIKDPENWILQKKVNYDTVIETPDGNAKAEIRLFYFWKKDWNRPIAVHNLARISKGEMIGTRYQSGKKWVGGTIAFFENERSFI